MLTSLHYIQVLIEFVKSAFIDFSSESLMVPWIYLCYNNDFSSDNEVSGPTSASASAKAGSAAGGSGDASATADKSKKQS